MSVHRIRKADIKSGTGSFHERGLRRKLKEITRIKKVRMCRGCSKPKTQCDCPKDMREAVRRYHNHREHYLRGQSVRSRDTRQAQALQVMRTRQRMWNALRTTIIRPVVAAAHYFTTLKTMVSWQRASRRGKAASRYCDG
jgi:hypothetical protein